MGGTIGGVPLLVASGIVPSTTYTDNLADSAITGKQLVLQVNTPIDAGGASGINCCAFWKGRMWIGVGGEQSPTFLCYSNYEQLYAFNILSQTVDIGGSPNPPASPFSVSDVCINLLAVGPYLLVLKGESTWVVSGNTGADFVSQQISNVGCCSRGSAAQGYGVAAWLSHDGVQLWNSGSGSIQNISDGYGASSIRGFLDSWFANCTVFNGGDEPGPQGDLYPSYYLSTPVGWFADRVYYLSFPQQGITFGYDLNSQQWFQSSQSTTAVYSQQSPLNQFSPYPTGGIFAANAAVPGTIDLWNAAETDYGNPIVSSFTSGISDSQKPWTSKQYRWVSVSAPYQPGATCTITVTADPTSGPTFTTNPIHLGDGAYTHYRSLPSKMVGTTCQITVNVTSSQKTVIDRVTVYGSDKRQFVKTGTT